MKVAANFLRKIADILDTKPHVPTDLPPAPLDLTDREISALAELRRSDEWGIFLKALDRRSVLVGEGLIRARDDANLHELRGQILGIRISGGLIDEIVNAQQQREVADERRRSAADEQHRRAIAATVNTPAFTRG